MEVLPEVESELEEAEFQEGEEEEEEEEGGEDEGLRELQELDEKLARVQIAPSAAHLPKQEAESDCSDWPVSYRKNSAQEQQLLAMADNFHSQYAHLYPDRKPLLLCPINECGVQKFVSTTLRPTLLPYPELHHWQGCASFVSDFLSLEPLDPPVDPPQKLRSPTWALRTQRGTCFEFSTLLCSLLLGTGYNAYCVSGYAVKEMCLLNQSHQECPLLKPQINEESVKPKPEVRRYSVKPLPDLCSSFEQRLKEKRQEESHTRLLSEQQEAQRLQEKLERPPPDPLLGLRVHCWVLVLSGNREVPENFFIDPLTGHSYPTTSEKFLGIESVWNHQNYWVNMQDCRFGCTEMTFDLGNLGKWEYLLCGSTNQSSLLNSDMKNQKQWNEDEDEEDEETEEPKVFEMPPSWVSKIQISQEELDSRCPAGRKLIRYRKATVEKFAPYLQMDGLVTRLTTYNDLDCTQPNLVREWFKHRDDHLEERELKKDTNTTTEHFRPGRSYALKCHTYVSMVPETDRQMDFYSHTRVDGLTSRIETPSEMTETFQDRPDFLYYRHVVYRQRVLAFGTAETPQDVQRPIKKVVERFHRDHSKAASEDVAERVFLLAKNQIHVTYHLEEDRIIPARRSFIKPCDPQNLFSPEMVSTFQVDPLENPSKNLFLYQTLMALMTEEEELILCIRKSEKEVRTILNVRLKEERAIKLQFSIYNVSKNETARCYREEKERLAKEDLLRKKEKELDVLAPFLARLGKPESLTREQAQQLRDDCLAELKQRLIDHANLIQARLEKETQELQQKQQWFQMNQSTITKEAEDTYLAFCSDSMFRIHVLKLRLNRHKEKAPQQYLALNDKLRQDPRLAQHLR